MFRLKFLIVLTGLLLAGGAAEAQQFNDTLQTCPFLYVYNFPDTSMKHGDSVECTLKRDHIDRDSWISWSAHPDIEDWIHTDRFAFHRHTDRPIKIIGIAFSFSLGVRPPDFPTVVLSLYDSTMNELICDTSLGMYLDHSNATYVPNDSSYQIFTVPGLYNVPLIVNGYLQTGCYHPGPEKLVLKKFYFPNDTGITVTGDFWIGYDRISNDIPTVLLEYHNDQRAYIYETDFKGHRYDGTWYDDTIYGVVPLLFPIVETECPEVTGLQTTIDSSGCVDIVWDSAEKPTQWVVEVQGNGLSISETVSSCRWRLCGIDTNEYYIVRVKAHCVESDTSTWSLWSDVKLFGRTRPLGTLGVPTLKVTLSPNPASERVTVSATGMQSVELLAVDGTVIMRRDGLHQDEYSLDLKGLSAGVYMVRVSTPLGTATRRLLVQ